MFGFIRKFLSKIFERGKSDTSVKEESKQDVEIESQDSNIPTSEEPKQSIATKYLNSVYYNRTKVDLVSIIKSRGACGELKIAMMLMNHFNPFYVFPNVYLPNYNGHTTEVDVILLSRKEIYLIEAKNWAGKIYGFQNSKDWTQYHKGQKREYHNPVKQNWSHFYAFRELYNIPQNRIVPLVVFNDLSELHVNVNSMPLIKRSDLIGFINDRQNKASDYFSENDLARMSADLEQYICLDEAQKEKHIQYVQSLKG